MRLVAVLFWITVHCFYAVEPKLNRPYDIYVNKDGKQYIFNSCPCGRTDHDAEEPRLDPSSDKELQKVESQLSHLLKATQENASRSSLYRTHKINNNLDTHSWTKKKKKSKPTKYGKKSKSTKYVKKSKATKYGNKSKPTKLGKKSKPTKYGKDTVPTYMRNYLRRMQAYGGERWVQKRWKREASSSELAVSLNITLELPGGIRRNQVVELNGPSGNGESSFKGTNYDEDLESADPSEENDFDDYDFEPEESMDDDDTIVRNDQLRTKEEPVVADLPKAHAFSSPWFATLENQKEYVCSGVLVNRKVILTSSNCVKSIKKIQDYKYNVKAFFGRQDVCEKAERRGHALESLVDLKNSSQYEIGIVVLRNVLLLTKQLHPICLPSQGVGTVYDNSEDVGVHFGFMAAQGGHNNNDCSLRTEAVKLIPVLNCPDLLFPTDLHKICAFNVETGPCMLKEGGPLVVRLHDRYTAIGIRIEHPGCRSKGPKKNIPKGEPSLYARLHSAVLRPLIPHLREGECIKKIPLLKDLGIHFVSQKKKKKKAKRPAVKFSIKKLSLKPLG